MIVWTEGFIVELRIRNLARDPHHLQAVLVSFAAKAVHVDRLVAECEQVVCRMDVAHRRMDVRWLDRIAGVYVDRVEVLAEPDEILKVRPVPGAAATRCVRHVRWTRHRRENHVVAAESNVVRWVRGMQREFWRAGGYQR